MKATLFRTVPEFRAWLEANHGAEPELWVRLRRTRSPVPGITYAEALDQALCFGWIDGVRHPGDEDYFAIRFTPRKAKSTWSNVNLRHYQRLERAGLVVSSGRAAFERRHPDRTGIYSFESWPRELPPAERRTFEANAAAWKFFNTQPPSYRRTANFWVLSAKREETRQRRLRQLIDDSANGRRLKMLARPAKTPAGKQAGSRLTPPAATAWTSIRGSPSPRRN